MKFIPLSRGLFATVDDADFIWLSQWKWSALKSGEGRFYAVRVEKRGEANGKPRMLLMHRELTAAPKGLVVDHRDNDGLNNRRANLRVCTQSQNCLNAQPHAHAKGSRRKGVSWHKQNRNWVAEFRGRHVGSFSDEDTAAAAYDRAAKAHSAEFALTNRELKEA